MNFNETRQLDLQRRCDELRSHAYAVNIYIFTKQSLDVEYILLLNAINLLLTLILFMTFPNNFSR